MTEARRQRLFRFVQLEFGWPLGPPDGRYILRDHAGDEPRHVLVISTSAAPRRPFGLARRARRAEPEPAPPEAPLTRATVVHALPVDEDEAEAWLRAAVGAGAADAVGEAAAALNRSLRSYRAAAADPYVREVLPGEALVTRAGYGEGFEVAEGLWASARELRAEDAARGRRERRAAALRPQERLAALLAGREAVLACEELALRARLDADHGRHREAALQTHLALEAAVVELQAWRDLADIATRLIELDGFRDPVAAAANQALQGGLDEPTREAAAKALDRLEAALRARAAAARY